MSIAGCPSCKRQVKDKSKFEKEVVTEKPSWYEGQQDMPFHKLLKELVTKKKDGVKELMIQGCDVLFPDTLFFENAQPSFLIQNDREGCLSIWNEDKPLPNITDLLSKIEKIVKVRKANKDHLWAEKQRKNRKM